MTTSDSSQGGYTFPCSATLPNLTLGIGSYHAVVPGEYINYSPARARNALVASNPRWDWHPFMVMSSSKANSSSFDGSSTPRLGFAAQAT
jgi:hypothetical protein